MLMKFSHVIPFCYTVSKEGTTGRGKSAGRRKYEKRKRWKHSGGHDPGNALETVAFATSLTHASRRAAKPGGFFEGKMRTSFEQTASLLDGPFSF